MVYYLSQKIKKKGRLIDDLFPRHFLLHIKKEAGWMGLLGVLQSHPHLPKHIFAEHTETIYFIKTIKEDLFHLYIVYITDGEIARKSNFFQN